MKKNGDENMYFINGILVKTGSEEEKIEQKVHSFIEMIKKYDSGEVGENDVIFGKSAIEQAFRDFINKKQNNVNSNK